MYAFKKTKRVTSARWYGKVNTVIIYGVMGMLLFFPHMPIVLAEGAIWFSTILMQISLILYTLYYIRILERHHKENE
jgi:phosphatidylglycerophosphate synthase